MNPLFFTRSNAVKVVQLMFKIKLRHPSDFLADIVKELLSMKNVLN